MSESAQEFMIFQLEEKEYGIDILKVQELMAWSTVTELPNTPDYLKGVINLRGVIVPIVDLRLRFGSDRVEYKETTVIIVLRASNSQHSIMVGMVVDAVSEVCKVSEDEIKPTPDLGEEIDNQFITSMAVINEKIVMLLDAARLLDVTELYRLSLYGRPAKQSEEQGDLHEA